MHLEKRKNVNGSKKIKVPHAPFWRNHSIVWTWANVFLAMVLYAVAWFIGGLIVMPFMDAIGLSYSFSAPWDDTVNFIRNCFLWHPIIALIGWFAYGILQSISKGRQTDYY